MLRRIAELRGLRERIHQRDESAFDDVRSVGQALRGSGGTFGYRELTTVAALVETAADADVPRRLEGLIVELHRLRAPDDPAGASGAPEWLALAAGRPPDDEALRGAPDLVAAWAAAAAACGVDEHELAGRVADALGLRTATELQPDRSALHVVPDALLREHLVLPLRQDATTIHVATADPAALGVERDLIELTGRMPVFVVAPPEELRAAVARALGDSPAVPERAVRGAQAAPTESDREAMRATPGDPPAAPAGAPMRAEASIAPPDAPVSIPPEAPPSASPVAPAVTPLRGPVPAGPRLMPPAGPPTPPAPPSILVVDDDGGTRLLVRTLLEKRGYRVMEAGDGREALEVMRVGGRFDLVVADLDMPRMDGLELIWQLRRTPEWSRVPAIVITGEQDADMEASMMEEGADDYIRKPLDPRLFLARVRATIRRAKR